VAAALVFLAISSSSALAQDQASREVLLSKTRLDPLRQRIEQRTDPTCSAWLNLKARAEGLVARQPHAPEHCYGPNPPLFAQTIAAEILRVAGRDPNDWRSREGHTLRQAFKLSANWTRNPASFPYWQRDPDQLRGVNYFSYFEILNAHWPNDEATALPRKSRPMTGSHSVPVLTFTHDDLPADGPVAPSQ
jgi:hypothetical protein